MTTLEGMHDIAASVPSPWWDFEQSISRCFEAQARSYANRIAIADDSHRLTYAELDARATNLAARVSHVGGAPGDRIAILMHHGVPLVTAVIAALKAGRVVVVLHPTDPIVRIAAAVEDCDPSLVVFDSAHETIARQVTGPQHRLVRADMPALAQPRSMPSIVRRADDLAFLVYTSGSAGRPKGVMQTHRMVLHNVWRLSHGMRLHADDRLTLLASLAAGQGISTMWCALLNGAMLCPYAIMQRGGVGFAKWMRERAITVLAASSSVFRHLTHTLGDEARLDSVRLVRLASEPATFDDCAVVRSRFSESCVLFNSLSSSETGNILQERIGPTDVIAGERLSAGFPPPGVDIVLRDEHGRQDNQVMLGEMVVRSRYLASGYWRDDRLTLQRFGEAGPDGTREYCSGDIARRTPSGALVFVGRADARVKIRGRRVEIADIEETIRGHPLVEHVAVVVRSAGAGDQQLVAFLTRRDDPGCNDASLRRSLRSLLSTGIAPSTWIVLDRMPMTASGKIDRDRLRVMAATPTPPSSSDGPLTPTENNLRNLWRKVLKNANVGRDDDFFDLGGDSLSAAVVVAHIHSAFGVDVDMAAFADAPVLMDQAALIDRLREANANHATILLTHVDRNQPLPLSFAQERIWRFSQTPEESRGYTMAFSHLLIGPFNIDAFRWCFDRVIERHESFRTTFDLVEGEPKQIIHAHATIDVPFIDLTRSTDPEAEADASYRALLAQPFDLTRLPLTRLLIARLRSDEHILFRVNHHIISDRWSWHLLFRELADLYDARVRGRTDANETAESLPLHVADYAVWERQTFNRENPGTCAKVDWWAATLGGNSTTRPLEVPVRRPQPSLDASPENGFILWGLDPEDSHRLDDVARHAGATHFGVRLAAFAAMTAIETGDSDFTLGTYLNLRQRADLLNVFGFMSNFVALRLRFDPALPFRAWVSHVQRSVRDVQTHGRLPFELLCEQLRAMGAPTPDIRTIFSTSDQSESMNFGGVSMTWMERRISTMPWGFTLCMNRQQESMNCYASFDARVYDPAAVRAMICRLQAFIPAAAARPGESCHALALSVGIEQRKSETMPSATPVDEPGQLPSIE